MKKIIVTFIFTLAFVFTSFGQTEKMKEKALDLVKQLNTEITTGDKDLALSKEQQEKIYKIHLERLMEIKKANKAKATKEQKQVIQKKYFSQIYKDVLDNKQMKARRAGMKKLKEQGN